MILFLYFLISMTLFATSDVAKALESVRLVSSEYRPFQDSAQPNRGVFDWTVREAFKRRGYAVELNYRPWIRALREVQDGKADAILGIWPHSSRESWMVISPAVTQNTMVFVKRSEAKIAENMRGQFEKDCAVGVVRGYAYPAEVLAGIQNSEGEVDDVANLRKLIKGRLCLVLIDQVVLNYLLSTDFKDFSSSLEVLSAHQYRTSLHVGFNLKSAKTTQLVDDLVAGLKILHKEGYFRTLNSKHPQLEIEFSNF